MKTVADFICAALKAQPQGITKGLEKAVPACPAGRPSPLAAKKLTFYCIVGLINGFKTQNSISNLWLYSADNQYLMPIRLLCNSINENNKYSLKNFQSDAEISKNGDGISNYFQVFSNYFEGISKLFPIRF